MESFVENISKKYSISEYLAIEENSIEKHEFYNGKINKMSGGTYNHNLIASNIITTLNILLEEKQQEYAVLGSDMKVYSPRILSFVYPDAVVVCEKPLFYEDRKDIITNPLLIVEVLSPSTEDYDRKGKFFDYKQIPSFKEYLLVEQNIAFITASYKIADRTWQDTEANGSDAYIYLKSIDCTISLSKIYKGIKF
ncbi:MAG: Uma2 family endonuclease [Bacteroidota bacterium]|nr:Uma2 family endonuclease [Bacteroidota bacterium]